MKSITRVAALFAVSIVAVPMSALADAPAPVQIESYPMQSDRYEDLMADRIAALKLSTEQSIKKNNLSAAKRARVEKVLESAVKDVNVGVRTATADGTVTRPESKQVAGLMQAADSQVTAEIALATKKRPKLGNLSGVLAK